MITFNNAFNDKSEQGYHGRAVKIIGVIANENSLKDRALIDPSCMPQFDIEFVDTGEQYTAYPEEIADKHWTDEMRAAVAGLHATSDKVPEGMNKTYFAHGRNLQKYK